MKVLVIAGTNLELYLFSAVTRLLKAKDDSLECKLLLRDIFQKNVTPEIRSLYSDVELYVMPALTPPFSKNPGKMAHNLFDNFMQYFLYRKLIKRNLSSADVAIISGFREFFASVACKLAPAGVRLVALRPANQKVEESLPFLRRPLIAFLLNLKNYLFGYSRMDYKWKKGTKNQLLTKDYLKYPYHRTIFMADHDVKHQGDSWRLPPPFIALKDLYQKEETVPSVLLAGEQLIFHQAWKQEEHKKYEALLDYLRANFGNYKLYFKPKLGQTHHESFNLQGFELLESDLSLEEICLRKNFQKIISIKSIASKLGSFFGASGYFLYPYFNFPQETTDIIEAEHDDMHSIVKVRDISDLKKEPEFGASSHTLSDLASLYWEAIIERSETPLDERSSI